MSWRRIEKQMKSCKPFSLCFVQEKKGHRVEFVETLYVYYDILADHKVKCLLSSEVPGFCNYRYSSNECNVYNITMSLFFADGVVWNKR